MTVLGDFDLANIRRQVETPEGFHRTATDLLNIPYCPWQPIQGPQSIFLLDLGRESLFGGAAGGSKSVALLMAASQFLDIPGYAALLLRRTFPDLNRPKALMPIAEQWWQGRPGVRYNGRDHTYFFACPGGGWSSVSFGSLDDRTARYKYQSAAFQFVGFDELTQFPLGDYTYLFSRMRRESSGPASSIPLRMRAASNPGGDGHQWVYDRFVAPWEAWLLHDAEEPARHFHPALLTDNPFLDRDDYTQSLMELDPVTREQLLRGDWSIRPEGRMFKRDWFKIIRREDIPGNARWVRAWDTAATEPDRGVDPDWTVGVRMGRTPDGAFYIDDVRRFRKSAAVNDVLMKATVLRDTRRVEQVMEQEPGASGKVAIRHYRVGPFATANFTGVPASGKSRGRVSTISAGRKTPMPKILAAGPLASHANAGEVHLVVDGSWDHEEFLRELEIFPDGNFDDQADAASLAMNWLTRMPIYAPKFGAGYESLTTDNYWSPAPVTWGPVADSGYHGERITEARQAFGDVEPEPVDAGEVARRMEAIYGV